MVSLIISVCFESGSACEVEQTILNNAILPKPQCDLDIGTQGKGKYFQIQVCFRYKLYKLVSCFIKTCIAHTKCISCTGNE